MKIIFQVSGGIGKSIAATAVCKAIKTQYPEAELIVLSGYPDVFAPNPNVSMSFGFGDLHYFYPMHIQGSNIVLDAAAGAPTAYGVIGGGQQNYIAPNTNHSSIFSGHNNSVADNCSSILGGVGNTIPAGFPNAHIVGSNIVLGAGVGNPNSIHVNGLWANGIPNASAGPFIPGTVFWWPSGTPLPFTPAATTGQLWIM